MRKIKLAVAGYGNVGRYAADAAISASDIELVGIIRRNADGTSVKGIPTVSDINKLDKPDAVILAVPSRNVKAEAEKYLSLGINTVDSFDIHSDILQLKTALNPICQKHSAVSVISAGWDPGLDSVMRAFFLMSAPKGITYTNFGPGMSMGHSVAAKAVTGVTDALSLTIPKGCGLHRRMVYVQTDGTRPFSEIENDILNDTYFKNDETYCIQTDDTEYLKDMGHGVAMQRKGVSGVTDNQIFEFNMRVNNPALTGQILVAAARACVRMQSGCYTMLEIPPVYYLPGETDEYIKHLV